MAIEAEELATITRSIRSAGQQTAGEFRKVANDNNLNLSKIVKDISTTFRAQREDIADLHNALEEMVSETQQTGNKIDSLNSLFRESLEIQNAMATQLSNVTKNTKILSGDIENLNRNIMNTTSSGLLGSINGIGKNLASELKLLGLAGAAAGAGYVAGGGLGGEIDVPGIKTSGSMAQNQQEAYKAARAEGLSDKAARIAVANVSGENLKNPGGVYADPSRRNPNQKAHGIVAWDDERSARIKSVFGKYPQEMSVADQTKAYIWEMKTHYKQAYNDLVNENLSEQQRLASVVENFEKPKDISGAVVNRMKFLKGLNVSEEKTSNPTTTSLTTPTTPKTTETVPSATAERVESMKTGHGPISGAAHESHAEKTEGSAALPSGDIVALGHALEKMGMRISEHPSFGTVHHVHKGSAHYEGRAIDINFGKGNVEASDPVLGAKFDNLAAQLTKLGYKVYWRESGAYGAKGHNNHLHAELPKGGATPTPDAYQIPGTPEQRAMQGATPLQTAPSTTAVPMPSTPQIQTTTSAEPAIPQPQPQTAPISPQPIVQNTQPQITPMAAMIPGMMGGGIGGIAGMLLPMIASAIQSEMVSVPSTPALNTQVVNQAAVNTQAIQQGSQEYQSMSVSPQVNSEPNRMQTADSSGFAYNIPGDIGWPDWASMIGGNHWEELNLFKPRMSRG